VRFLFFLTLSYSHSSRANGAVFFLRRSDYYVASSKTLSDALATIGYLMDKRCCSGVAVELEAVLGVVFVGLGGWVLGKGDQLGRV